nr:hypothetical protein GCM10020093_049770 [Planobispora longispora]
MAFWQRGRDDGAALAYWRDRLADPPVLELPLDRPRPRVPAHAGGFHSFRLPAGLSADLERLGQEHGATLFMVLLAAYQVLLARHTGQDDVTVGSPAAGRDHVAFEPVVGYFANTLVLRGDLSGDPSFADLLRRTRTTVLEALAHQDVPFERLLTELDVERDLSRTPLFQTMVILHTQDEEGEPRTTFADLSLEYFDAGFRQAKFDLMLEGRRDADGLSSRSATTPSCSRRRPSPPSPAGSPSCAARSRPTPAARSPRCRPVRPATTPGCGSWRRRSPARRVPSCPPSSARRPPPTPTPPR